MQSTGRLVSLYRLLKIARPVVNVIKLICLLFTKYLRYWKYHLSFDDGKIFANIV
jgi:hypothetical protein